MSKVHLLPPEIISKIAAGEVIERPASVVKELIENSIDAGAEDIELYIEGAGKTLISLKDSGNGIEKDDLEKIFLRHATSKIDAIDDLFSINSLGFRGEALYSIAAISDIVLRSKTKDSDSGWEIHMRGGDKLSLKPVAMNNGTEIEIRELFFNTPARRKFLKTDATELNQIISVFTPYTLLYPEKRFILKTPSNTVFDLQKTDNLSKRAQDALNVKAEYILFAKQDIENKDLSIRALLGDINIQRPKKTLQFIFVNGRPVHDHTLSFHINQIYRLIMPSTTHPFFCLYLRIPPEKVDANIHPTKREVRIKDDINLTSTLRALCEHTLLTKGKPKQVQPQESVFNASTAFLKDQPMKEPSRTFRIKSSSPAQKRETQKIFSIARENAQIEYAKSSRPSDALQDKLITAAYIGPFINKYLLFESCASLLIIDQHAAHERITYEKFREQIKSGTIEIQPLLTPFIIETTSQEMLEWESIKDKLEAMGFSTTQWDKRNIALHSHPNLIKNAETALRNIISEKDIPGFDADALARRACRKSVMAGDKLDAESSYRLRDDLMACKDPFVCPHGRPTVIEIKDRFLEKEFLRT